MECNKSIEKIIEEKRAEMMAIEGEVTIGAIYKEIQEIASNMTLEPICREVLCKPFFEVGDKDFVTLLYHQILLREPDQEGYANTLELLISKKYTKAQLLQAFVNSDEGSKNNIKLVGLRKEVVKQKIGNLVKVIPGAGYIGRWVVNIVLLSKRISGLYNSYNMLFLQCQGLKQENEQLKRAYNLIYNQNAEINNRELVLEEEFLELRNKNSAMEERNRNFIIAEGEKVRAAEKKAKIDKQLYDSFYLRYNERLMSDSREVVKTRAVPYIEKLDAWCQETQRSKSDLKIVDLGCGECEWIELLSENGYFADGVDNNEAVFNKVRAELPDIKISLAGALEYLQSCPSESIDCLSSFHMFEHMDFISIITLLKECHRVLKKDGMLIIETPNPQNILTASYYFYLDPTHIKPIPPELMQFYVEESGFMLYEKVLLNPLNFEPYEYKEDDPIKDIVFRFNMEQAYSIMAVKK